MLLTQLSNALDRAFGTDVPTKLGVAVSGGGDSMALLDLLRLWGKAELAVVSVNHGLRTEAAEELGLVASYVAQHDLSHDILQWHWDRTGNLQNAAREGRRTAIADWAKANKLQHVALGHTQDDQAETFLMRLSRGSGVDGLACMSELRNRDGLTWLRPMLEISREDLRQHLRDNGILWADDPSNEDPRFDRVKARQMYETLTPLGLTTDRLAQTAAHMGRERDVRDWALNTAAQNYATLDAGDVVLEAEAQKALPEALYSRLMAEALSAVSGAEYKPRFRALRAAIEAGQPISLHGCLILPSKQSVRITRELAAIQETRCHVSEIWDGRWRFVPPEGLDVTEMEIAALGEQGLREIDDWRSLGRPRPSVLASPAVWHGEKLIAAPLAGLKNGWHVRHLPHTSVFGTTC
ncbi:tRNA lysidine(34) synthetase TilS [Shimia sp. MIT910701]|uniref:tRNA lysidine(34) synthetase TilS n=1 Tax=Shimia sp. MIT910701 TaxID=3096987 RepID=UPI00399B4822|nr:tRNA lysidine(34) synthetase TilS [Shimia sp.]